MRRVELTAEAIEAVDSMIESHELPDDTWDRVLAGLTVLERFPNAGRALTGRWHGYRALIGPWGWMLLVYATDAADDLATAALRRGLALAASTARPARVGGLLGGGGCDEGGGVIDR